MIERNNSRYKKAKDINAGEKIALNYGNPTGYVVLSLTDEKSEAVTLLVLIDKDEPIRYTP